MRKELKLKPCENCQDIVKIRYCIQYDDRGKWYKVCPSCWEVLAKVNPYYRYGGTWKAK